MAIYFIAARRPRLACAALAAAMIPTGLSMIDGIGRMAPVSLTADEEQKVLSYLRYLEGFPSNG